MSFSRLYGVTSSSFDLQALGFIIWLNSFLLLCWSCLDFLNNNFVFGLGLKTKPPSTMADNDDLLDYEDEEQPEQAVVDGSGDTGAKKEVKGTYVSIHSSGFRDFLLKPEILRAIVDCGFEHPSEGMLLGDNFLICSSETFFFFFQNTVSLQFSMNAFLKQFLAWTFCAKLSLVWEKLLCSYWPPFNSWSQQRIRFMCWSCATPENWHSRSVKNMNVSQSTCLRSR